uniref:B30.2/SPRY domain-containing protein n=1 Tax=Callorhinchus milii TaxID=7868 RepID=A0A4W3GXR1_CALMI
MGPRLFKAQGPPPTGSGERSPFWGLGVSPPSRLGLLLDLPPAPHEERLRHSWDPAQSSPNMTVGAEDRRTARRCPASSSSDCVRAGPGYREGLHVWEVVWPSGQRGSHAAVGVGTARARLQAPGYSALVGSDSESWGWELGRNQLYHGSKVPAPGTYPPSPGGPLPVPPSFLLILDADQGSLSFLVDGEYLGAAFTGLRGRTLYPMVSSVWGDSSITLTYINSVDREPPPTSLTCSSSPHPTSGALSSQSRLTL